MNSHNPSDKSEATRLAHAEARRRAASVARFGLVIALSVAVALVFFESPRLPLHWQ